MSETTPEPVVDHITVRQNEVAQYDQTIAIYQQIAATLPSEWPAHLAHLKTRTDTHQAIAEVADLDDVALVSQLWARDQAEASIRSNMVERAKAQAILDALVAQQA